MDGRLKIREIIKIGKYLYIKTAKQHQFLGNKEIQKGKCLKTAKVKRARHTHVGNLESGIKCNDIQDFLQINDVETVLCENLTFGKRDDGAKFFQIEVGYTAKT